MNPQEQQERLMFFLDAFPPEVAAAFGVKEIDIFILLNELCGANGLVLYEMGNICEGVRKVLAGEDSPANLVAYIEQDPNIEEDNRPKIPALAYEIQQKIFDPVLPILKQAGFPIKEGRVPAPPAQPATSFQVQGSSQKNLDVRSQNLAASPVPLTANSLQLEPNHIRALTRIAAGTKYSEQELGETFEELPIGLRQSLSSVDTANAIERVAKKHLLHVDQMASLASEAGLVLLGLTHLADFVANLARRLRLPDDQAREIARDISAEIFVKVRDALRGLHEPKPAVSVERLAVSEKTQSAEKSAGTSAGSSSQVSSPPVPGLNANRYTLNASPQTPFSPQAKWNTGINQQPTTNNQLPKEENILARQARLKESLTREEVLRGIENPRLNQPPGPAVSVERLAVSKERGNMAPIPPMPNIQAPPPVMQKSRPQSESAFPPPKPKPEPEDFLDQKLQAPMTVPREERRYTVDPYREPLN